MPLLYSGLLMRARGPLVALLALVVAVWSVVVTRPALPVVAVAPPAAAPPPALRDIGNLDRASDRLQAGRVAATPPPSAAPGRNPFEFEAPKPKPARTMSPAQALAAVAPPILLPPALPSVSLVGLVDRELNGRIVRTAVLSFGGQLHYVEAGSRLGGAYEVVAVGPHEVDLLALDTNTPRRLVQR
jgi:hypothetical protein